MADCAGLVQTLTAIAANAISSRIGSMRILSILAFSPPGNTSGTGGAELQMHSLHKGLRARGIDLHVLAEISHVGKKYQEFEGIPVWGAKFPTLTSHALRPGNIKIIGSLMGINRLVKRNMGRFDLIQAITFRQPAMVGAWLSRRLEVPLIVRISGSGTYGDFFFAQSNWLLRRSLPEIVRRTACVVALNEATKGEAVANGVPRDKIEIIPNAVIIESAGRMRDLGNLRKAGTLVYVGRIRAGKRVDTLLAALRGLVRIDAGRKLVMVGGGDLPELRGAIEKYRLDQWVSVIGFDPNPEKHLHNAACFINPSESEGMPNAVLEACAFGIPVILSDIPAHREIARAVGMEAFLFPVGDSIALSKKIVELFNLSEHQYSELKRKCTEYGQRFSTENRDRDYVQLYENVLRKYCT
jgi:glycosyltransferase involved in cell wall biosynthesis